MSTHRSESLGNLIGAPVVTREIVAAAMRRGRCERSLAFWALLRRILHQVGGTANEQRPRPNCERTAAATP